MPPEQLRSNGWGVDERNGTHETIGGSSNGDIYAFGLVLYELHTRKGPFGPDAPQPRSLLPRIATAHPAPLR